MKSKSLHLIDRQTADLLEKYPTITLDSDNLMVWRTWKPPADVVVVDQTSVDVESSTSIHSVAGPEGAPNIELLIYRPRRLRPAAGCIFHIHGGGFILGDAATEAPGDSLLSHELDCVVATVEYRLAPETRFPGNIEDCYAALLWVFGHCVELGIDPSKIGLMGRSAGGGLAAALALMARDRGVLRLAFQHLIYPMLDDRTCILDDPNPYAGEFLWTRQNNHFAWSALLGRAPGSEGISPYAAAARAHVLDALPPTFIATGALDLFAEENIEYARRLMRAGVPTELHVYAGGVHGFDLHPSAEVSRAARRDSLAALTRFLA